MRESRLTIAYFCLTQSMGTFFTQLNKFLEFFNAIWELKTLNFVKYFRSFFFYKTVVQIAYLTMIVEFCQVSVFRSDHFMASRRKNGTKLKKKFFFYVFLDYGLNIL